MPASGFAAMALPHAQIGSAKGMPLLAHPRGPGPPGREEVAAEGAERKRHFAQHIAQRLCNYLYHIDDCIPKGNRTPVGGMKTRCPNL